MAPADEIASFEFFASTSRSSERRRVRVWITRPEETPDGDWVCRLEADDLVRGPRIGVHGASSLQALCLAVRLARTQLDDFRDRGGRLHCAEEGPEEVPLDAIFGDSVG